MSTNTTSSTSPATDNFFQPVRSEELHKGATVYVPVAQGTFCKAKVKGIIDGYYLLESLVPSVSLRMKECNIKDLFVKCD